MDSNMDMNLNEFLDQADRFGVEVPEERRLYLRLCEKRAELDDDTQALVDYLREALPDGGLSRNEPLDRAIHVAKAISRFVDARLDRHKTSVYHINHT